jgi:Tfp pilus assembly protein PilF
MYAFYHRQLSRTLNEPAGKGPPTSSENLGWVLRAEHDLDRARSRFEEALRTNRQIGDKRGMESAINGLAS